MRRCLVTLFGILTAGCSNVISLSPAVSASSAVMDERLLGEWVQDSSRKQARVTVTRGNDRTYQVHIMEDGVSATGTGRLMPVGQRWLLDLTPTQASAKAIDELGGISVHSLIVLELSERMIRAATINGDTLRARVRRGAGPSLELANAPGGDVMLTDSTARLEAALPQYLSSPGITHDWTTYRRPPIQGESIPRSAVHLTMSSKVREFARTSSPENAVSKGILYGALIGGAGGAIIGASISDPEPRAMFTGPGYGALGGGVAGVILGAIVGGITGGLRQ